MYLKNLNLYFFRNYHQQEIKFDAPKIILMGNNAQGKSNLLEAIEILSILKSHRSNQDQYLIQENKLKAQIKANVDRKLADYQLSLTLRRNGRRTLNLNGENIKRNSDFLGSLNIVFFSSLDLDLVRGGPEYRRNWVDNLLIQLEPFYDHILKQYYQVLRQRNALLKAFKKQDNDLNNSNIVNNQSARDLQLKVWDEKLAEMGTRVTRRRARVLNRITPLAQKWHSQISSKTEDLKISYTPNITWIEDDPIEIKKAIKNKIQQRRLAELNLGSTVVGPHRDEIEFTINDTPTRCYGSQGQQRTLVLALKLAELQLIEQVIGEPPLLLLDDVLAELDCQRQNHLLDALGDRFQTFITTTHLNSFEHKLLENSQILRVENGNIQKF
jgi:DNA replication and repair protein RecF